MKKYIGEGARIVRELFVMALEHQPSIILKDELDNIGGKRKHRGRDSYTEIERTMLE